MNDRTNGQMNNVLDRAEQILAEQSLRMDNVTAALDRLANLAEQIGTSNNRRLQQHDLELDDHNERTERLEKIVLEHDQRHETQEINISELKEIQADVKSMLAILIGRSSGEIT